MRSRGSREGNRKAETVAHWGQVTGCRTKPERGCRFLGAPPSETGASLFNELWTGDDPRRVPASLSPVACPLSPVFCPLYSVSGLCSPVSGLESPDHCLQYF